MFYICVSSLKLYMIGIDIYDLYDIDDIYDVLEDTLDDIQLIVRSYSIYI